MSMESDSPTNPPPSEQDAGENEESEMVSRTLKVLLKMKIVRPPSALLGDIGEASIRVSGEAVTDVMTALLGRPSRDPQTEEEGAAINNLLRSFGAGSEDDLEADLGGLFGGLGGFLRQLSQELVGFSSEEQIGLDNDLDLPVGSSETDLASFMSHITGVTNEDTGGLLEEDEVVEKEDQVGLGQSGVDCKREDAEATAHAEDDRSAALSEAEKLRHLLERERDLRRCLICSDRRKSVLLLPCKHICLCRRCARRVMHSRYINGAQRRQCPVCRQGVVRVENVYY